MSEWISIKDQEPNIYEWVLVYSSYPIKEYDHGVKIFVAQMSMNGDMRCFECAYGDGYIPDWIHNTITHWMPLPKEPVSEWKKYPENKPENDINCVVKNIRRPFDSFLAMYSTYDDAFWQYEPNAINKPYIAVTHYIEIPALPLEEWK